LTHVHKVSELAVPVTSVPHQSNTCSELALPVTGSELAVASSIVA
jgi:hypothetical protein